MVLWRPEGSALEQVRSYFVGGYPRLNDTSVVHSDGDRFELNTSTMGRVHAQFHVVVRGAADLGVDCGSGISSGS